MADEMNSSSENPCGNATEVTDYLVPMKTIESFLRYVRNDTDVIAVKIANESLDKGETVEKILTSKSGLRLSVAALPDESYDFHVSCIAGSGRDVVGDGGNWKVDVDHDGNVIRAIPEGRVFYD